MCTECIRLICVIFIIFIIFVITCADTGHPSITIAHSMFNH